MNNRQARIKRLKAAFQKAEALMNEGHIVQWDGEAVENFCWDSGLDLDHGNWCYSGVYADSDEFSDLADLTIAEIDAELKERLTICKKVEIKL